MNCAAPPVTCGVASLVPEKVCNLPLNQVEMMQSPGAAMSTSAPKFEKTRNVSSGWFEHDCGPKCPGCPSVSAIPETVMTWSKAAGTRVLALVPSLPAATTTGTPASTTLQIA